MTLQEFMARTKPISPEDRRSILSDISALASSPLWDVPSTPMDRIRSDAFDRAWILLGSLSIIRGELVMREGFPTIVAGVHTFLLYSLRGQKS